MSKLQHDYYLHYIKGIHVMTDEIIGQLRAEKINFNVVFTLFHSITLQAETAMQDMVMAKEVSDSIIDKLQIAEPTKLKD